MIRYDTMTLSEYLEKLALREPVPGGGSAAACSASGIGCRSGNGNAYPATDPAGAFHSGTQRRARAGGLP